MSLDETPPLGSNEWLEEFKKKNEELRARLKAIGERIKAVSKIVKETHADMILDSIGTNEELRQKFIDKLYDPFYEPTPVEAIVIKKLLGEQDG
jgi:uncharacterized protein YjgD (DUF1641 family)